MKGITVSKLVFAAFLTLLACHTYADSTIIKFGSTWKYLDNGSDAGTIWKEVAGSGTDSWPGGPAEFGYGNGDERTLVNYGSEDAKNITTYFRTSFNVTNKRQFSFFRLRVYFDDGLVVYVNGKEVCRTNMGGGIIKFNTLAARETPDNGNIIMPFNIPAESFINGINNISVEVHQASRKSDDLTFDLELSGISNDKPTEVTRGPLLQMVNGSAITITWKTNENASSKILYGSSENSLPYFVKSDMLSKDHELRITGLQPDTKYYYAIGNGNDVLEGSYRNYFITSPPANTTRKIRIGVFGDAGTGDRNQKRGRDNYLQLFKKDKGAELAIMLGDNAYNTGTDNEYQTNFFDVYDDNIFNNNVVFPIPGNHEYYSPGVPYFSIFNLPTAAESGGLASGTESYYSFNYGNIHFIMLNSMGHDGGTLLRDSTGEQAVWLKKDLAANAGTHKWIIACLHHPPYSNGTHSSDGEPELIGLRQQITPILERYGVDAVLAGHSHVYERSFLIQGHTGVASTFKSTSPPAGNLVNGSSARYDGTVNSCPYFTIDTVEKKGTVYVVAGSAGQIGGGTNAGMPLFYYKNYSGSSGGESGILYLEVQDNRLDAKFVGNSGIVRDQFTIMKGVNSKKIIAAELNKSIDLTASWIGSYNWLPTPPAGEDGFKTLTVKPARAETYIYFVKDSLGTNKACISDTFEVQAYSPTSSTVKFEARQKYNSVLIKWSLDKEPNLSYFTLERSSNGRDFSTLNIIKASNNTISGASLLAATKQDIYEFEDNYPVHGNNYYRLTKTNKTGPALSVGIRMISYEPVKSFTCKIKSNASSSNMVNITIESANKQVLQVNVYDISGKAVYHDSLSAIQGNNLIKVALKPGTYVFNIVGADNTQISEKIVLR